MDEIRHGVGGDRSVRLYELWADVDITDTVVGQRCNLSVDGGDFDASAIRRLLAAREDSHQDDVSVGAAPFVLFNQNLDALGNLIGAVLVGIVGANHQHDDFRIDAVDLTFAETPQDVLYLVSLNAEISRVGLVALVPNCCACPLPSVRDGIAVEDDIGMLVPIAVEFVLDILVPIVAWCGYRRGINPGRDAGLVDRFRGDGRELASQLA